MAQIAPFFIVAPIIALLLRFVSAECYGPNTCIEGYVWRQAVSDDYVCVTPATRSQAWEDNSLAASRVNPAGGPYGPDTCLDGYVWRQAVPTDHVCVTPATRTQTWEDNSQASDRVLSMNIWVTDWAPEPYDYPYIKVNGDHFNYGPVQVVIFNDDGSEAQGWTTYTAGSYPGYVAGAFGAETQVNDCSSEVPAGTTNGYVQVYDVTSGCYSEKLRVDVCFNL